MRSELVEQVLEKFGYTWNYEPSILLSDIKIEHAENPGRDQREKNANIDAIARDLRLGLQMPAPVLVPSRGRASYRYDVADGVHRLKAMKEEDIRDTDAYVVNSVDNSRERDALFVMWNSRNGDPEPEDTTLKRALDFSKKYPEVDMKAIGEIFNLTLHGFRNFKEQSEIAERAKYMDLATEVESPYYGEMPNDLKHLVSKIDNDNLFAATLQALITTKVRGAEAKVLVASVRDARTEAQGYAVVEQFRRENSRPPAAVGAGARRAYSRNTYQMLYSAAGQVISKAKSPRLAISSENEVNARKMRDRMALTEEAAREKKIAYGNRVDEIAAARHTATARGGRRRPISIPSVVSEEDRPE